MPNTFANPKLFAAVTVLFALATFANLSMSSQEAGSPLMARPGASSTVMEASAR